MFTIFGSAGFIGSNLTRYLRSLGHDVKEIGRGVPVANEDLGDAIYCAGVTSDFRTRPFDTVTAHVSYMSEIAEKAKFRSFLYLSSTRLYMNSTNTSPEDELTVNPNNGSDLYNLSKLMGECLLLNSGLQGVKIARLSNVLGLDLGSNNFALDLCRQAVDGDITLQTSLGSSKDYIHINDTVRYLAAIAMSSSNKIYNVASGTNHTNSEIVDRLSALTNCTFSVQPSAITVANTPIDVRALHAEFGQPRYDALDALLQIVTELRKK
jgi:nucleoside-diphosphate-sugar epimerase